MNKRLLATALAAAMLLGGCGASKSADQAKPPAAGAGMQQAANPAQTAAAPKIIQQATLSLDTDDLGKVEKAMLAIVAQKQGRLDLLNVTADADGQRRGQYTLRVPQDRLAGTIDELAALPGVSVRERRLSSQDVTEQYIDINARLENMKRQEAKLQELLARAGSVDETLKVESELARVRTQLDSATGQLKSLSGRIEMATLNVTVREAGAGVWKNYGGKLGTAFGEGLDMAGRLLLAVITFGIGLTPLAAAAGGGVWLWRRLKRRRGAANKAG